MDSNSIWTASNIIALVSVVLAAIAIGVSLWIYFNQKNKKELFYKVITNESLLSYKKDLEKDLIITYKNQKVNNLVLFSIVFQNTGNVPILKNEFDTDINLNFVDINSIISAEVSTEGLNDFPLEVTNKTISIPPILINPMDEIYIKILVDSDSIKPFFAVDSRIAGVFMIKNHKYKKFVKNSTLSIIISSVMTILYFLILMSKPKDMTGWIIGALLVLAQLILSIAFFYSVKTSTKLGRFS